MSTLHRPDTTTTDQSLTYRPPDIGLEPDSEYTRSFEFRLTRKEDLPAIEEIMSYWLGRYHDQFPKHGPKRELLRRILSGNCSRLLDFVSGNSPGLHFYTLARAGGPVLGVTGYLSENKIEPHLRAYLDAKQELVAKDGVRFDLRAPVPEMYLLYKTPDPRYKHVPLGRMAVNGLKSAIYRETGSDWYVFTSRSVWIHHGWQFYRRQPDFIELGSLGELGTHCEPGEEDTLGFLVRDCCQPVSVYS